MTEQRIIIESLAMDLKRVALGLQRGSTKMGDRFTVEALRREEELERQKIDGYVRKLIAGCRKSLQANNDRTAEDVLMYSTLFQNYAQKNF